MRFPIRLKLAGALAVPMAALVGVAGYEVSQADARAQEVTHETELATSTVGPGSLITALQNERNFTAAMSSGFADQMDYSVSSLEEARANTDSARAQLQAFADRSGGDVAEAFGPGLEAVAVQLAEVRAYVDSTETTPGINPENVELTSTIFGNFSAMIEILIDGAGGLAYQVDDADLRTGVELIGLATLNIEQSAQITSGILLPYITGVDPIGIRTKAAAMVADFRHQQAEMLARSNGPYAGLPEAVIDSAANTAQLDQWDLFIRTGEADLATMATAASAGSTGTIAQELRSTIATALQGQADHLVNEADTQRQTVLLLAVVLVVVALLVTLAASRSITNPLRSLTRQAREMATNRLPHAVQQVLDTPAGEDVVVPEVAPITVKTRDEVANVAAALNTVQTSALDLAVEQAALRKNIADSFVNLGRRNQNLVDRQLEFITDLERQEQEPERLEGLFRLDHLATRMRRNAESLLRLAGGGDTTNTGWGGPVPMVDVVRGALGEVEEYDRVDVRTLEPAQITAAAGSDLAHALAELVENALHFSPPTERVQIRGRRGHDGGYVLAVIDQGMGMSPEQLETANRRLAGQESFTVAPSRYLGHYIAGHLAATLGLTITLAQEAVGGIIARIDIPAHLLVEAPPVRADEPRPARTVLPVEYQPEPLPSGPVPLAPIASDEDDQWRSPPPSGDHPAGTPVPAPEPAPATAPTLGGLSRRVRGANAPTATNVAAAFGGQIPTDEQRPMIATAQDVSSFLTAFNGGVERGLATGHDEPDTP